MILQNQYIIIEEANFNEELRKIQEHLGSNFYIKAMWPLTTEITYRTAESNDGRLMDTKRVASWRVHIIKEVP